MEKHKNLLQVLGDWWADRQTRASVQRPSPSRPNQILRWFIPNGGTLLIVAMLLMTQTLWAKPFAAINAPGPSATTVNYQGRLSDSDGVPLDGTYGMRFALYDAATDGSLVWGPEEHTAVEVSDGLFSVGLGSKTSGGIPTTTWDGDRYLEITVGGETLEPRELIRSVPIAGMALTVPDGAITSEKLSLRSDSACLTEHVSVALPGGYSLVDVPGLDLTFTLDSDSSVLVWMDGSAYFNGPDGSQFSLAIALDGTAAATADLSYDHPKSFNISGLNIVELNSGTHTLQAYVGSAKAGEGVVRGHETGSFRTCVHYLVIGE